MDLLPGDTGLVLLVLWPALYAGYSVFLVRARAKDRGTAALIVIAAVHYLGAGIGIATCDYSLADFHKTVLVCLDESFIALVLFVGLHVLTISYGLGIVRWPFHYSLRTLLWAVTIAAILCSIYASILARPR
ncbi:MAG: hypothetical protein NTW96_06995 [Planctomycetia bacterium]|nr:hypothetical protein [Planctomycetia bacterium]